MAFDFKKFIGGFALWQGEKFGKILYYSVLLTIFGFILYSAFIKPTQKSVQDLKGAFRGAKIEKVVIEQKSEQDKRVWSVGPFLGVDTDGAVSFGISVTRKF